MVEAGFLLSVALYISERVAHEVVEAGFLLSVAWYISETEKG